MRPTNVLQPTAGRARIADSSSTNAVSFSSARTTKRFPSSRCASATKIVRPREEDYLSAPVAVKKNCGCGSLSDACDACGAFDGFDGFGAFDGFDGFDAACHS